jgi:hypothetical protein
MASDQSTSPGPVLGAQHTLPSRPNTVRAYRSDWLTFAWWCGERGLDARRATAESVAQYVRWLRDHRYAVSTVLRAYHGVVWWLRKLSPNEWPRGRRPDVCYDALRWVLETRPYPEYR